MSAHWQEDVPIYRGYVSAHWQGDVPTPLTRLLLTKKQIDYERRKLWMPQAGNVNGVRRDRMPQGERLESCRRWLSVEPEYIFLFAADGNQADVDVISNTRWDVL